MLKSFEDTVKDSVSFIRDMEVASFNKKMTSTDWNIIGEIVMVKQREAIESYKSGIVLKIENTPAISTFSKDDPISYTGDEDGLVDMDSYMKKRDIISLIKSK